MCCVGTCILNFSTRKCVKTAPLLSQHALCVLFTFHCTVITDRSWSQSIHSKHSNIVGYSWYTRHCVASHRRVHLCVYQCAVNTGIIRHYIVKDWEIFYQGWRLKKQQNVNHTILISSHTCHITAVIPAISLQSYLPYHCSHTCHITAVIPAISLQSYLPYHCSHTCHITAVIPAISLQSYLPYHFNVCLF